VSVPWFATFGIFFVPRTAKIDQAQALRLGLDDQVSWFDVSMGAHREIMKLGKTVGKARIEGPRGVCARPRPASLFRSIQIAKERGPPDPGRHHPDLILPPLKIMDCRKAVETTQPPENVELLLRMPRPWQEMDHPQILGRGIVYLQLTPASIPQPINEPVRPTTQPLGTPHGVGVAAAADLFRWAMRHRRGTFGPV
jgi:hypothetical protein